MNRRQRKKHDKKLAARGVPNYWWARAKWIETYGAPPPPMADIFMRAMGAHYSELERIVKQECERTYQALGDWQDRLDSLNVPEVKGRLQELLAPDGFPADAGVPYQTYLKQRPTDSAAT